MGKKESVFKGKFSKDNIQKFFKNAAWTYKSLFRIAPFDFILNIVVVIVTASFPTINSYLYSLSLDQIVKLIGSRNVDALLSLSHPFVKILIIMAAFGVLKSVINQFSRFIDFRFRAIHLEKYRNELYLQIANLDIEQLEDPTTSNLIQKAKDNLFKVRDFVNISTTVLTGIVSLTIAGTIVIGRSPLLALLLTILSIPSTYIWSKYILEWWRYYDDNAENFKKRGWIMGSIGEDKGIPENRVTGAINRLSTNLNSIWMMLSGREMKMRKDNIKEATLVQIFDFITDIFVPVYFAIDLVIGKITLGQYNFLTGRTFDFSNQLSGVLNNFVDLFDAGLGVDNVRQVAELRPCLIDGTKKLRLKNAPTIELKNVWFKYPKGKDYVLKNVNMTIKPGEEIAIVGENGAGKTTLIKLILRFYDVTKGEILINGVNIKDLKIEDYHDLIGVLFQDYNTYGFLTVEENIAIGQRKKKNGNSIKKAAMLADAADFINKLELKYKQVMHKSFTNGINLSTGQKQKVALARMFYRDAPVLILDEPTASIDAVAEHKIFSRIYKFMHNKTVIIISHRFSTVRNAKKIYVIKNGTIEEEGSHEELIKRNGIYHKSFSLQAKGYN